MYISVSSQTTLQNIANFFSFSLEDASAPGVYLEIVTPAKPYGNPIQISFTYNCISGHMYRIVLWESLSGGATGVVRNSFSETINGQNVLVKMPEYLTVGTTAGLVANATTYVNTSWVNFSYMLHGRTKVMFHDGTTSPDPDYHQVATGGFSLVRTGDVFLNSEEFVVNFVPLVIGAPSGTPSGPFGSGRIITTDQTLTGADINQALIIQGAADKITIDLPDPDTIPDFTSFIHLISAGGNHINARIRTVGAGKIVYPGILTELSLGQAENLICFPFNKNWYVFNDLFGVRSVGEVLYNYSNLEINTVLCNGQLLGREKYTRLWAFVQSLEAGVVVSDASWSTFTNNASTDGATVYPNKGRFSLGDGSTTFRMPLLTNTSLKGTAANPGSFENHMSVFHDHSTPHSLSGSGGGFGYVGGSSPFQDPFNPTGPMKLFGTADLVSLVGLEVRVKSKLIYCLMRY